jgi:hypothetical protein
VLHICWQCSPNYRHITRILDLSNPVEIWFNVSHISINIIGFSDSFGKTIRSLKWPSVELTHTNILLVRCGFTHHMLTPIHSTAKIWLPLLQLIGIFDVGQECFSHLQSWYVLPQTPPHRIHDEHGIIRGILSVYLKFFMWTFCSDARTVWELFQTLEGDTNHNEEC